MLSDLIKILLVCILLFNSCDCDDDSGRDVPSHGSQSEEDSTVEESSSNVKDSNDEPALAKKAKIAPKPVRPRRTKKPRVVTRSPLHPRLNIVPKLMIFEPDRLLWPFHYETDVKLPYDLVQPTAWPIPKGGKGRRWCTGNFGGRELVDDNGKCLQLNYDALILFLRLQKRGIKMAVAATINNSSKINGMKHLIRMFEFEDLFSFSEVDEASPIEHVIRIKEKSGLQFRDLVYLGCNQTVLDEINNELKVIVVHVDPRRGLDIQDAQEAARLYAIRPHVPGPQEESLSVGKIVSDEAAANLYGSEVMKMQREMSSEGHASDASLEEETVENSEIMRNSSMLSD